MEVIDSLSAGLRPTPLLLIECGGWCCGDRFWGWWMLRMLGLSAGFCMVILLAMRLCIELLRAGNGRCRSLKLAAFCPTPLLA